MNTQDKARFFGNYWGQDVFVALHNNGEKNFSGLVCSLAIDDCENGCLELTPFHQ